MAKFTIEQMEKADKERQCREKKLNEGLNLKQFSPRDRQAPVLDVVVYRLEFPKLYNSKETLKLFHRVAGMISYHRRKSEKGKDMIAVIGYSEHKAWTPYAEVSGQKGGRGKKTFKHSEAARVAPYVHIYLSGQNSRKISEIIWETQGKYWGKHYPKSKYPAFKSFAYSVNHLPANYVTEQSTYTRMFGDVDSYIERHRIDNDPLDFDG